VYLPFVFIPVGPTWSLGHPWNAVSHQFLNLGQLVGLLGRGEGGLAYDKATQGSTNRINADNIHALGGIQTHEPSIRASKDISCPRLHGHWDQQTIVYKWVTQPVLKLVLEAEFHYHFYVTMWHVILCSLTCIGTCAASNWKSSALFQYYAIAYKLK
jgi:hypothetical protein